MAKTASERQAAYRARPDQYRLSLYINGEARAALTALARHRGCSQREVVDVHRGHERIFFSDDQRLDHLARFYEQVTR